MQTCGSQDGRIVPKPDLRFYRAVQSVNAAIFRKFSAIVTDRFCTRPKALFCGRRSLCGQRFSPREIRFCFTKTSMPIDSFLQRLFSLKDKTALVTGASGGLGRAMAVALAGAGARIGIHGTKADKLEQTRQAVEQAGGDGVVLSASLGDAAQCQKLAADAQSALGRIDILLNCAGTSRRKLIDTVTQEEFDWIIGVNLRSAFFLSQAVHPDDAPAGRWQDHQYRVDDFHAWLCQPVGLWHDEIGPGAGTKTMAIEWAADNIQVNCVAPGFMHTALTEEYYWKDPHRSRWMYERIPARRAGLPEDLAGIVVWLASPASSYVTGQVIAVDGGFTAGGSWEQASGSR